MEETEIKADFFLDEFPKVGVSKWFDLANERSYHEENLSRQEQPIRLMLCLIEKL